MKAKKTIRAAEKTVAQARKTLDKAEKGLMEAAERVSDTVDDARSRPVLKTSMLVGLLSLIGMFVFMALRD
ncbi:MAG TPA: hypothetical protein VLB67_03655 [Acidimicrobiia bacterium]|nr:hypothetical protein [Acidimicrobiia bacterium]